MSEAKETTFRTRLLESLRAIQPILRVPGVMVVGSEVPNLLEPDAAATLVRSKDVDIGIPVDAHEEVRDTLQGVDELETFEDLFVQLAPEHQHTVYSNLTILSLLDSRPGLPDPQGHRDRIARLVSSIEPHLEESV